MELIDRGIVWQVTELERGRLVATDGKQVISECGLEALEAAVKASDPNNPRIDAVVQLTGITLCGGTGKF